MRPRRVSRCWSSTAATSAVRPAHPRASRTISAFRPASPAWPSWAGPTTRRRSSAPRWRFRPRRRTFEAMPRGLASGGSSSVSRTTNASARAVVVASGARYRRLHVNDLEAFESTSVHYWASPVEARLCAGQEVALVGGGNSAGQAVVSLASQVAKVWLLVRRPSLDARMSRYLVDRIAGLPNVEVVMQAEVTGLEGHDGALAAIRWRQSGEEVRRPIRHLFLFIGAEPYTDWLSGCDIALDDKGF